MTGPRSKKFRTLTILGIGGVAILTGLFVTVSKHGAFHLTGMPRVVAATAGMALLGGWWLVFAFRLSGAMDEYQRWAEHRAWYVGGLAGLIVSLPVYAFVSLGGLHMLNPATDAGPVAARAFGSGYMLPIMMQVLGAVTFALWARFARR